MSSSTTQVNPRAGAAEPVAAGFGGAYPRLLGALPLVAAAAAALNFAWPQVLSGPAVMNGSARGTALVVLVVAVPTLAASIGPVVDRLPAPPIAIYIWVVVLLNALAWLVVRAIRPASAVTEGSTQPQRT